MSSYSRYQDRHKKSNNPSSNSLSNSLKLLSQEEKKVLLTDKEAYINYLEQNNEKFNQLNEKIIIFEQNQTNYEEKFENITKLIKLLQSFAEASEETNSTLKQNFQLIQDQLHIKIEENSLNIDTIEQKMYENLNQVDNSVQMVENKMTLLVQKIQKNVEQELDQFKQEIQFPISIPRPPDFSTIREEINKKIEIVMNEVRNSAMKEDIVDLEIRMRKESIENIKKIKNKEKQTKNQEKQTKLSRASSELDDKSEFGQDEISVNRGSKSPGASKARVSKSPIHSKNTKSPNRSLLKDQGADLATLQKQIDEIKQIQNNIILKITKNQEKNKQKFVTNKNFKVLQENFEQTLNNEIFNLKQILTNFINNQKGQVEILLAQKGKRQSNQLSSESVLQEMVPEKDQQISFNVSVQKNNQDIPFNLQKNICTNFNDESSLSSHSVGSKKLNKLSQRYKSADTRNPKSKSKPKLVVSEIEKVVKPEPNPNISPKPSKIIQERKNKEDNIKQLLKKKRDKVSKNIDVIQFINKPKAPLQSIRKNSQKKIPKI